ncbi:MAG: enoyl-CoA hydratase-related protein [Cytophagaceae bacterium]|jgi:methylglutaconyl-CoA hydratase|nr:enoyl-CoA hydratase-related protein [Cytophagaceae bacterium]
MNQHILVEKKNRIGYIIINRPEKRNALNDATVTELKEAFTTFESDDEVKIIILKATGNAFCAGADLEYLTQLESNSYEDNLADSTHLMELYYTIYQLKKVVIAQVHGHALAGGCGLVSVCDFSFSVPEANFGYTENRIGFVPAIVMIFLIRKIGEAKAREMLLSGNVIKASQAVQYGLVTSLVDAEEDLEKTVEDFAQHLVIHNASSSMATTKIMLAQIQDKPLLEALRYAAKMNAKTRSSEDCRKGIHAFLNKENIKW